MFKSYLKIAWRNILRYKVISFINIMGLSTGLAFVLLIAVFIKNEMSYDQFHQNKNSLYRVAGIGTDDKGNVFKSGNTKAILAPIVTPATPEIKSFCRVDGQELLIKKDNNAITQTVVMADSSFFSMFSFPLINGRAETVLRSPDEAVITDETAMKIFGTKDVIGNRLEIELEGNFIPFRISGITKRPPDNSTIFFDVIIPFNHPASSNKPEDLQSSFVNTFILTSEKIDKKKVEAEISEIYKKYTGNNQQMQSLIKFKYVLQNLTDMHLSEDFYVNTGLRNWSNKIYSYVLGTIAVFILLIACINFINLVLARSIKRAREIGIRKVAGGTRKQLIFQFLTESLTVTFFSVLPAILLIILLLPYFSQFVKMEIHLAQVLDSTMMMISLLLIILIGILAGFYPALVLSGYKPVQALSSKIKLSGKNILGKSLIVFQFILAVFFIISTLTMQDQFRFLADKDLGYQTEHVVVVSVPRENHKKVLPLLKNELLMIPGVQKTTVTNWGMNRTKLTVEGNTTDWVYYQLIDENFIDLFGMKILRGRNFYTSSVADSSNCIINEAFAHSMHWEEAIGKQIGYRNRMLTVVGVTRDYHNASLKEEIKPIVLMKRDSSNFGKLYISYLPGLREKVVSATHNSFKKIDPYHNEEIADLKLLNEESYASQKSWQGIVNFSAIVCILLSCLGLFGLSSLNISQRLKEIGIRKVLGAGVSEIMIMMSKDILKLVAVASVITFPLGWLVMNNWLQDFAYRVDINWMIFIGAAAIAVLTALITISFQTLKAAFGNPVKNLRMD